jgi:hypothetical protein
MEYNLFQRYIAQSINPSASAHNSTAESMPMVKVAFG